MALHLSTPLKVKTPGSYELRQRFRRAVLWACLLASPFFLGLIAGWVFGIRFNLTPSLPRGFYIISHSPSANLVEFCPQGAAASISLSRHYRTAGVAWSGPPAALPLSLVAPLLIYRAKSRSNAYASMFCYYGAASWPLLPGARAFFGVQGPPLVGLALCLPAAALLALPWGLLST